MAVDRTAKDRWGTPGPVQWPKPNAQRTSPSKPRCRNIFRPRGFFMREPRCPAKTRDVTPVFSATYAHIATAGVSLPPTPQVEKNDAGAEPGARNSRKSRPHQRHLGSGLYGASGSLEHFTMAEMDLRVMGERQVNGPNHTPPPNIPRIKSSAKSSSRQLSHRPTAGSSPICFSNDFGTSVTLGSTSLTFT